MSRRYISLTIIAAIVLAGCSSTSTLSENDERERLIEAARRSGNPNFALLIAQRHVEENPNDLESHLTYAKLLAEVQQCDRAELVLDRAMALTHQESKGTREETHEHRQLLAKYSLQCKAFNKVILITQLQEEEGGSSDADLLNMKGIAFDNLGNHSDAQSAYQEALSLRPDQKFAYNLALSLLLSGQTEPSHAVAMRIQQGEFAEEVPKRSIIILESLILAKSGRKDEAVTLLSSVVSPDEAVDLLSQMK